VSATCEDAKRYSAPVTYYNGDLKERLGVREWRTMDAAGPTNDAGGNCEHATIHRARENQDFPRRFLSPSRIVINRW
jgi:hypothetical protein